MKKLLMLSLASLLLLSACSFGGSKPSSDTTMEDSMNSENEKKSVFYSLLDEMDEQPIFGRSSLEDGSLPSEIAALTMLKRVVIDNCPPEPDGICGYTLEIYGPSDYAEEELTDFYFGQVGGAGMTFFGPFHADLSAVLAELDDVDTIKR